MSDRRVVYGVGPCSELLRRKGSHVDCLLVSEKRLAKGGKDPVGKLVGEAKQRNVKWSAVQNKELDRLTGGERHQGVVAIAGHFSYCDLHDLVERAGEPPLLVALDGVTDPHNLGAIVRSALLLGAHGLILPRDRSAQVTPLVTKTAAGATETLPIAQVTNLVRALEELKEEGYWRAAVASHPKAVALNELDASLPLVLVLGSEGKGIRPLVQKACDYFLEIPMAASAVGSFNVSVAAAISLYEVSRQRAS